MAQVSYVHKFTVKIGELDIDGEVSLDPAGEAYIKVNKDPGVNLEARKVLNEIFEAVHKLYKLSGDPFTTFEIKKK